MRLLIITCKDNQNSGITRFKQRFIAIGLIPLTVCPFLTEIFVILQFFAGKRNNLEYNQDETGH